MFRKRFLFLFIVIMVGFGLLWVEDYTTSITQENTEGAAVLPDYYGDGLKNRSFDSNGRLESQFEAQRSVHYPDKKQAELTYPKFTTTTDDGEVWVVRSVAGTHYENDKRMVLKNDVVISPIANTTTSSNNSSDFTTISTSQLTLFTDTNIAQTDKPVEVINSHSQINAVGMIINIDLKRVEFLSQVNAKYEP